MKPANELQIITLLSSWMRFTPKGRQLITQIAGAYHYLITGDPQIPLPWNLLIQYFDSQTPTWSHFTKETRKGLKINTFN